MNKLVLPPYVDGNYLDEILKFGLEQGVSDFHIMSESEIKVDIHGRINILADRKLSHNEVLEFAKYIYKGENATTRLNSAKAIDEAHVLKINHKRQRFRVNMVSCQVKSRNGIQITIRTIDEKPKTVEELNVESDIYENCFPSQGIVFVTGPTGSGKSTLLAAMINSYFQKENLNKKLITLESPIEYVYDHIKNNSVMIAQTEIPTHQLNFTEGLEAALRRKPDIILVGEARDKETINAAINAAQTGHLVLTTLHTNGVGASFRRLLAYFSPEERDEKMSALIDSTQFIITQRLEKTNDGKRRPIKEYLKFDKEIKEKLFKSNFNQISNVINNQVKENKNSMYDNALKLYNENLITKEQLKNIENSF